MAVIATGSKTIIDLSDGKMLSVHIGSNQPRTQIYDSNGGSYTPDWTTSEGRVVLTPVIYANNQPVGNEDVHLTVNWKKRNGSGPEEILSSNESVVGNVLTVSANVAGDVTSGLVTYIAYVRYNDPDTNIPINAIADITFSLVRTGKNAKSAWISGEQVFKYAANGSVSPLQIELTANLQNVGTGRWEYKDSAGTWKNYPTTSDNISVTGQTLKIKPAHAIWNGSVATIRFVSSDVNVYDVTTVYKVQDGQTGAQGAPGSAGQNASIVFLTNEHIGFPADASGRISAQTKVCNVVAFTGATKVVPRLGAISGAPSGMTVVVGTPVGNEIPLTIAIAGNANLGSASANTGEVLIPVTSPVTTTLKLFWSKTNNGANGQNGANGANSVVFTVYAPKGTVFTNGAGTLELHTQAFDGPVEITSGAAYLWEKYESGAYHAVPGQTSKTLSVDGSSVTGTSVYRVKMTYKGKVYTDAITLEDKTDNYQAVIDSTGGDVFKNAVGTSKLTCRLFQNGKEVDAAAPYQKTYRWYKRDKDGEPIGSGVWKTGKEITVTGDDVDGKTTFVCEVL